MREKLPLWFDITLIFAITFLFFVGALKTLSGKGTISLETALGGSMPALLLLLIYIFLKVFVVYDLATLIVVFSLFVSIIIFYFGFVESDKDKKAALLTFAGSLLGFGTGIPIGKQLSPDEGNNQKPNNGKTI